MKTICNQCNEEVGMLSEGTCEVCAPELEVKESEYMALSDYRNIYTFTGRSDGLNLIVYGIVLPLVIIGLSFATRNSVAVSVGLLLAVIMLFAAVVRRGRDAGKSPTHTVVTLLITSFVISSVMEQTMLSFYIIIYSGNYILGMIVVAVIQNIYLVYLIFAARSEVESPKTSKPVKIILILMGSLFLIGILASVLIPKFA